MVVLLFNTVICVFLLLGLCILTVRLPWLRFLHLFLSCKANARVYLTKMGHGPHPSKIFVLFYVLFVLCRSVYCLCVNVYCTTANGWRPNCSWQIYHIFRTEHSPDASKHTVWRLLPSHWYSLKLKAARHRHLFKEAKRELRYNN
jgi:hypothetical protein